MASLKPLLFVFALITGAILLSGCIQGPQGPKGDKGDPGDAAPAGALIQGPNRVIVYTPYMLLDPATGMNGSITNAFNLTSAFLSNTSGYKPDYPRNMMVNGTNITSTVTVNITGYDSLGNSAKTETLLLSSTIWQTNGSVAWYNVSNISWSSTSGTYEAVSAGWGWKFGLPGLVKSKSDIMGVTVAGYGNTTDQQTWDFTNNTVQFVTAPNGAIDYNVYYRQYGVVPP